MDSDRNPFFLRNFDKQNKKRECFEMTDWMELL